MSEDQNNYITKAKTIFRTIKDKENPFVMMDRRPLENEYLSWRAKGILAYLLSRPDNWTVRLQDLVNRSCDGVYMIRGALKELEKAGHLSRRAERDPKTKRITQYILEIYELPFTSKPLTNLPQAGLPQAGNLMLKDTDLTNIEDKNIKDSGVSTPRPRKANQIPEVVLYREVTHLYPPKVNFEEVVCSVSKVRERLGREITKADLLTFYQAWCHKGYKPTNLSWLEWAETGQIPANGNWKPRNQEPQSFAGIREFLKEQDVKPA